MTDNDYAKLIDERVNKYLDVVMENIADTEAILFEALSNIKTLRALAQMKK